MKKKKILKFVLGTLVIGSVFNLSSVKVSAEWRNENNSWKYVENNNYATGWNKYSGKWYYFNNSGIMQTGWVHDSGKWYYLSNSGDMKTGWVEDNGSWYYLSDSGAMQTGWIKYKGTWYYLNSHGIMQTGAVSVAGKIYYLNENGAMQTGNITIGGKNYKFDSNGEAVGNIPAVNKDKIFSENKKWKLVWQDDFLGDKLDETNWNYERHEPGYVNNELQEYTDSKDNVFVKDGKLVIKAIETRKHGEKYYTSGRVTTQNKKAFKYGKFEIKAKAPKGQGLWPALWMMPNDKNLYGEWPKSGEIDIMEVLGHKPNKVYGTVHYGNPHEQQQGSYVLESGALADEYHVYGLEWEPNEMRFYIDGTLYHKVTNWYTKAEGGNTKPFPAPFNQPFYLQCNLAVGGDWPGNPDRTTDFDNAELKVDYVKVYQLENK